MKLNISVTLVLLVTYIHAYAFNLKGRDDDFCPIFQRKCPDCKKTETCIYPNSGGCEGAGIPVCKPRNCHRVLCLARNIPCPKECPFSCKYEKAPPCCPFNGTPVCEAPCETFAPCKVTPCPSECPDDCFYPNADYCCPLSGKPVCRRRRRRHTGD